MALKNLQELLNNIVESTFPREYQTQGESPILTSVQTVSKQWLKSHNHDKPETAEIPALTIDWEKLYMRAKLPESAQEWSGKYAIFVCAELSDPMMVLFTLCHELGHVAALYTGKVFGSSEVCELNADLYAFTLLSDLYGTAAGFELMEKYASPEGWGEYKRLVTMEDDPKDD